MPKRLFLAMAALAFSACASIAATLLPPGEQQFFDANGNPLAGGLVYFYIPNTLTPKNVYLDPAGATVGANPVVLDSAGRAVIYGTGSYRERITDSNGNLIWDQLTADTSSTSQSYAGNSGGTANAVTITAANFTNSDGQTIIFKAASTNTGAATLNVNGTGGIVIYADAANGPQPLVGGEIVSGDFATVIYDATLGAFHLIAAQPNNAAVTLASASTVDLGTAVSHTITISGTTTITSLGATATASSPIYFITFSGALTLTYNATSLILPGGANIQTATGDVAIAIYLGSGNWRVISYQQAASFGSGPSGSISMFAAQTAPAGWLECNGSAISRTTYATLFAAIGTTYGSGDGSTTFNLPDFRGYFARGWDHGAGNDSGRTFGTTQQDALQEFTATWASRADAAVSGAISSAGSGASPAGTGSTSSTVNNLTVDPSITARTATETRPKNVAVLYIIKY